MGMSEAEFFDCTPRYFMRRRRAFLENRNGRENARYIAYYVMKAAGAKIRRLTAIERFPWDVVVRRVDLEAWDSPAMVKFSEDADKALAILNPEAYAKYMAGKQAREEAQPPHTDPEMTIEAELNFD
jgi:hypothetical protein